MELLFNIKVPLRTIIPAPFLATARACHKPVPARTERCLAHTPNELAAQILAPALVLMELLLSQAVAKLTIKQVKSLAAVLVSLNLAHVIMVSWVELTL